MVMRIAFILSIFMFIAKLASAQELNCRVNVIHNEVKNVDEEIFRSMKKSITEFMNDRVWTKHIYDQQERIEMNVQIKITTAPSSSSFKASFQIQATRPVFGSTYNSIMFNHVEKDVLFNYAEFEPLEYDDNTFMSNLTSVLAYYTYVILGIDYDSFGVKGGNEFFTRAERVVNNAQGSEYTSWSSNEDNSRRQMISDFLESQYSGLRECYYIYHRKGLDIMYEKPDEGRRQVLESLRKLEKVYRNKPNAFLLDVFFNAKKKELIDIFTGGTADEKTQAVNILKKINSANAPDYDAINK